MKADVAILIVTYNSAEQIEVCLRSAIRERQNVSQQIIVLDNNSTDETVAIIRRDFPQVTLLTPGKNLGFAAGVNEAARHADAEFLLLLNPDTEVLDHAIDRVVEFARANPGHGLYGGRTLKPDGSLEPSSCWGLPTLWSYFTFASGLSTIFRHNPLLDPESLGSWQRDTVRTVGIITGCFLLVSRTAWEQLQGFDERYFMYGEDADLAARVHALGCRPVICPEARVMHEVGSSSTPIHKMRLLFRGKATYSRTHWHGLRQRIALGLLLVGVVARAFPQTLRKNKDERWLTLWRERRDWIGGYPPLIKTRVQSPTVPSLTSRS